MARAMVRQEQYRDECRVGQESELLEIRELWMSQGHSMASPVQDQDSAWSGRSGVWVRAGQDSSTTRADSERDRASRGRIRTGSGPGQNKTRQAGQAGVGGPPLRTCTGRAQRVGRI